MTFKVIQGGVGSYLKANMRLPIGHQKQLRPYLAPFSHNSA